MTITIPEQLIDKMRSKECVAFVGAGFSVGAGFPNWRELIELMMAWCDRNEVSLDGSIRSAAYPEASNEIYRRVSEKGGESQTEKMLTEILADPEKRPHVLHELLATLPVTAVFTTNFDTLIERQFPQATVFTYDSSPDYTQHYRNKQFHIFKLHGTVSNTPCIWTQIQFDKIAQENKHNDLREYLRLVFNTRTVLFMGYSFGDPDMHAVLSYLKVNQGRSANVHYALVASDHPDHSVTSLKERFGVEAIRYDVDHLHTGVGVFLRRLTYLVHQ